MNGHRGVGGGQTFGSLTLAIFIPGMACVLSGRPIDSLSEAVMFPPFVVNEADPLHVFSDAVIHAEAFRAHPLAAAAQARYDEARVRFAPANRRCLICGQVVVDPEDYLGLGHLTELAAHPLYRFTTDTSTCPTCRGGSD